MSLADIRAQRQGLPTPEVLAEVERQAAVEEPYGVAQVVTPGGLEIYYQAGPKRLYQIRNNDVSADWFEVPSVSTVLEVLEKGGLSWWGMKVGIDGVRQLSETGIAEGVYVTSDDLLAQGTDGIVELLTKHKLTVNHVKGAAADRGTNVHTALENFAETGIIPDPRFYPENERGYVEGLVAFINDANPHVHHSELMVASTDGWAGRFDMVANLDFAGELVTKTYPKKKPIRSTVSGNWLLDLKTSKDVYPSYKIQTAAYRQGLVECGYDDVDHMGVVRVTDDGRYELVESTATYEDFLSVLAVYHAIGRLK